MKILRDGYAACTCAVVAAYKREWRVKTGRIDHYVPHGIRCQVHLTAEGGHDD